TIPSSVVNLSIEVTSGPLQNGTIPISVKTLSIIGQNSLTTGLIPSSVDTLYIQTTSFDNFETGSIPDSVYTLTLNGIITNCNHLKSILPKYLTKLTLDGDITQPIKPGTLPNSITFLSMPSFNDILIVGAFPNDLTHLNMHSYNLPLSYKVLPMSLTYLHLDNFNQTFKWNKLKLEHLVLTTYNDFILPNTLPTTLKILDAKHALPKVYSFPSDGNLEEITCSCPYLDLAMKLLLPNSVTSLKVYSRNNNNNTLPYIHYLVHHTVTNALKKYVDNSKTNDSITNLEIYYQNDRLNIGQNIHQFANLERLKIDYANLIQLNLPYRHSFNQTIRTVLITSSSKNISLEDLQQPSSPYLIKLLKMFRPGTTISIEVNQKYNNQLLFVSRILDRSTILIISPVSNLGGFFK
ncbi:hypothetical protein SAMD00019534_124240, partial [Acytostelium subglobosum LB1]|uniref:hypothetical protein n=1 Tax=Acytostelium subglobosum LB1 TaxID=1410327 RepID=UPI00064497F2